MEDSISRFIERRAIYIGFALYVVLVFVIPFLFISIGRMADHELMHNYIVPFSKYKFMLIVIAGLLTGMVSIYSPLVNSIYVGLLGLLVWLIFSSISMSITGADFSIKLISLQSIERVLLCAVGGLFISLYRVAMGNNKNKKGG